MRSHYCQDINKEHIGEEVTLVGWVNKCRDLGGVIFLDLRDVSGLVQVIYNPELKGPFDLASTLKQEFCIQIVGTVRARPESQVNSNMATGAIEIVGSDLNIFNSAKPLPLTLDDKQSEDVRMRYRYLDLRRPSMTHALLFRAKVTSFIRNFLDNNRFIDIETPILTKATPEGARDYLVPSRTYPGQFFALPQSPQIFKQLLMMSGMDRYYQIVKCFRDEDLRADRQPEFTQIDIETSFMTSKQVRDVAEEMVRSMFLRLLGVDLGTFPIMTYAQAMRDYGSDKPDLRNPMILKEVDFLVKDVDFKVFQEPANSVTGKVIALCVPNGASLSRKQIDDYTKYVSIFGAKGLAWMKVNDIELLSDGVQSPIAKFFTKDQLDRLLQALDAKTNDLIFFGADVAKIATDAMGALRLKVGEDLDLVAKEWRPLWVVDFPMFEEADGRLYSSHHPFTSPTNLDIESLETNPKEALSDAYDMVLNGCEVGGGSVRIHNANLQATIFKLLGISETEAEDKFGFLLEALKYGTPPHAGVAFGLDRLVMLMLGATSIRDVMAFPKTTTAACLLTNAPSYASSQQLAELSLIPAPRKEEE